MLQLKTAVAILQSVCLLKELQKRLATPFLEPRALTVLLFRPKQTANRGSGIRRELVALPARGARQNFQVLGVLGLVVEQLSSSLGQ